MQKTIFVVDDIDTNLMTAKLALKDSYRVYTIPSAAKMFSMLEKIHPNLILLDIEMPDMDGFEALMKLKEHELYSNIPVIFLTSMTDSATEAKGFDMGVIDFIHKPFSAPVLQNRIKSHLDINEIILERTARLRRLKNGIVFVLADMVENRDEGTGSHIERTTKYIELLVNALQERGLYDVLFQDIDLDSFISSARLHDVGKIGVSDTILNKPGRLTDEEYTIMKTHTTMGEEIINLIIERTEDLENPFLQHAKLFAGYHHERWDGKGYPYGLSKTEIPIQGRIMAFVDVYDALVSERPYKKAFSHEEAIQIILEGIGTQFDPDIGEVFKEIHELFRVISQN